VGIADTQPEHEPVGKGLGQQRGRAVRGLRCPGPDVGDGRAEHHPLGRREQHGQLHEGVLAADGLVGPHGAATGAFEPANRLALLIGG
jgi:hypothetical protein